MARGRSKTIVQKIALDVPTYREEHLNLGDPTLKSLPLKLTELAQISETYSLYPFNDKESSKLWSKYLETFDFDCLLPEEDIQRINEYQTNDLLNFKNTCVTSRKEIASLIDQTDSIRDSVSTLRTIYDQISHENSDFDKESSELLKVQQDHQRKLDEINNHLLHFERLDTITKNLSRNGYHLINKKKEYFKNEILKNLDASIQYVESHPEIKDITLYKSRFRQCMTRSLTLIKSFLNDELKRIADLTSRQLNTKDNENLDFLIYNDFNQYQTDSFSEWVTEIYTRVSIHEEYRGLLLEVLNSYFNIRLKLIKIYIELVTFNENDKSPVQISQDRISFYKRIIEKEASLAERYLTKNVLMLANGEFYDFLKKTLDTLYDFLRQIILRETNITNLCQLSILLQKYYEFEEEERSESIDYGNLFRPILDDIQMRLIFRIQIYVDQSLTKYKPKPEDLIGNRKVAGTNTLDIDYPQNLFPHVYLPLAKALTLLSEIYELIDHVVFDDLAHYIIHSSIQLLHGEFYKLSLAHLGKIDTELQYLKNLILLKLQLNNYDIQFSRNDFSIDFTGGLNDAWKSIRSGQFQLTSSGFIDIVRKSAPRIINSMVDANEEIELELNNAVNDFVKECANVISEPILTDLKDFVQYKHNLLTKIPHFYKQTQVHIEDRSIIHYLMNNLTNLIVVMYENYYRNQEDNNLMEVDTLFAFVNDIVAEEENNAQNDEEQNTFNEDILQDLEISDDEDLLINNRNLDLKGNLQKDASESTNTIDPPSEVLQN